MLTITSNLILWSKVLRLLLFAAILNVSLMAYMHLVIKYVLKSPLKKFHTLPHHSWYIYSSVCSNVSPTPKPQLTNQS